MSGRIATAPIRTDVATAGDYRSRALVGDQRDLPRDHPDEKQAQDHAPETPVRPAAPPSSGAMLGDGGTAFAAAVVAGALPPRAQSPEEMQLRRSTWAPPSSELHLTDRIA